MAYKNQQVINATGGAFTISNTTQREYVSLTHFAGANVVLNNNGISLNSPQNFQMKVDNDAFTTIMGDNNLYYHQNSWERVNIDKHIIIGDSIALTTNAYDNWNVAFADITSANTQPDTSAGGYPLLPGVPLDQVPKPAEDGKRLEDPSITELKTKINSDKILNDASWLSNKSPDLKAKVHSKLASDQSAAAKNITNSSKKTISGLKGSSTSTQNGQYTPNENKSKLADVIAETQTKLNDIERLMGEGGNWIENIARNKRVIVGAAVNNHPQAILNPIGRQVPSAVSVDENGITTKTAGIPEINEVDNASVFPCGNYNIEVGNRFSVKSGGGGLSFITTGSINLNSDVSLKLGGHQVVMSARDINLKGNDNVSIESDNLNLTSSNQIVLNGNVGVNSNMLVKGGIYVDGELYVNHITAPLEIQNTLPGFTSAGAFGFFIRDSSVEGKLTMDNASVTINGYGATLSFSEQPCVMKFTSNGLCVELLPHAHEFVNLPLTLTTSGDSSAQAAVRSSANSLAKSTPSKASGIANGNKYPIGSFNNTDLLDNNTSKSVFLFS
ncbi:MAG: hypothetical protein EBU90_20035 [Proteobacteria bacterium]|nr:hypothetical protein [Pseudomonadota bacterium]